VSFNVPRCRPRLQPLRFAEQGNRLACTCTIGELAG
jgi:hypothetical protein